MVINWGRCPETLLYLFHKGLCRFPYVLVITLQPLTLIPVYYSTLLCDVILVLRGYWEASDGIAPHKVDLYAYFTTYVLKNFTKTLV